MKAERGKLTDPESRNEKRARASMRLLALLDMGLEEIGRRRDPVKALVEAWDRDPLAFLERMQKLVEPDAGQQKGGNTLNFNGLFGLVAKEAGQPLQALPPATDAEYTELGTGAKPVGYIDDGGTGVQSGSKPEQPIDW
jgi:hypothetical protein